LLSTKLKKAIEFKEIKIGDKDLIKSYLSKVNYKICDLSFPNIFSWRKIYNTRYDIIDNFLVIQSNKDNKNPSYLMPIGIGDKKGILLKLMDYAKQNSQQFKLVAITKEMQQEIEAVLPGIFEYIENRDFSDYVYKTESLITLAGKKLHAKRNHINKFKSTYNYEYVDITKDNIEECIELHNQWCIINNCDGSDKYMNEETCAVKCMLKNFFELDVFGGAIKVDDKMVAFTIGSKITQDTIDIHVEKALYEYNGIYPAINQFFLEKNSQGLEYVNREEDLGKEGLRKSKLSYNPFLLLEKKIAVIK
jgi:hypothetical protein